MRIAFGTEYPLAVRLMQTTAGDQEQVRAHTEEFGDTPGPSRGFEQGRKSFVSP
jgi:hypothetical protein